MLSDGLDFLPGWYRTEKEAGKAIQKLMHTGELNVFLKNPDPYIRRLAILHMGEIRHKDAYPLLHEILSDPVETEENRKLAALIMSKLNKELHLGFFISHPYLSQFTGDENLDELLRVSVIDSLPDLSFDFRGFSIESQLNLTYEAAKAEISAKEASFPFPLRQWMLHFYSNLSKNFFKYLKKLIRGAVAALFVTGPRKVSALFSSLLARLKEKRNEGRSLPEASPPPSQRQKRRLVIYKSSSRYSIPLRIRVRGVIRGFLHCLFFPLRFLSRYKLVAFMTLLVLYSLFSFTQPGKSFLFRINPQAYYMNTAFLEKTEQWALHLISSNSTLSLVFKTKPVPPPITQKVTPEAVKIYKVTAPKGLYLRSKPGPSEHRLFLMTTHTVVEFLGEEKRDASGNLWLRVRLRDMTGWANAQYLKEEK